MDQKKSQEQSHPLRSEPGRRYAAGRVRPRTEASAYAPRNPGVSGVQKLASGTRVSGHVDSIRPPEIPVKKQPKHHPRPALPRTTKSTVLRRQMVEHASQHKKQVRHVYRRHFLGYLVAATVMLAFGVVLWAFRGLLPVNIDWFERGAPSSTVSISPEAAENRSLDQTPVTAEEIESYQMANDAPRVIRVPKLNVESRVRRVGVSLNGEPIAPTNIFDVGWFEASGKPGQEGAVLINGHTVGSTVNGVFFSLGELIPGDQILVERGDYTVLTYEVLRIQTYSSTEVDMIAAMQSADPTKKGLNLMTTPIRYNGRPDALNKRIIVFTVESSPN